MLFSPADWLIYSAWNGRAIGGDRYDQRERCLDQPATHHRNQLKLPPKRTLFPSAATNMASQTEDTDRDPALREQFNFHALMQVINTCQSTLMVTIEIMQLDISLIRRDMDCFCSRLAEAERRVGVTEDTLLPSAHCIRRLRPWRHEQKMLKTATGGIICSVRLP